MNLIQFFTRPKPARSSSSPLEPKRGPLLPGRRSGKGQSLVETAVALPVFMLLLLGVFEVGWALRAYLVLANVNREATRFAARGVYLDLKQKDDPTLVGYDKVVSHTYNALSAQLNPLSLDAAAGNSSIIVTYYNVEPQAFVCPGDDDCSDYNCSQFELGHASYVAGESYNIIEYPLLSPPAPLASNPKLPDWYTNPVLSVSNTRPITGYYFYQGPATNLNALSRIDPEKKVLELRSQNNKQNCELLKKRLPPASNNVIVIENIYYLEQLVGLPFISAFIPNPIPLYTHTAMRMVTNVRALDEPDEEASNCELLPFAIPESKVSGHLQGQEFIIPYNTSNDIMPGSFGWVEWDSDANSSATSEADNLQNPGNAGRDYDEPPGGTDDNAIDMFLDWIESNPGATLSNEKKTLLAGYIASGKVLYFPVWRDVCTTDCDTYYTGSGTNGKYRVMTYVALKIKGSVDLLYGNNSAQCNGANKCLKFEFSHFAPGQCPGNGE